MLPTTVLISRKPPSFPVVSLITNLLDASRNLVTWSSLKKQLNAVVADLMILQNLEHQPEVDWNLIYNCHDISLAWRIFKDILVTLFNKFASVITKRVQEKCSWLKSAKIKSHMNISHMDIRDKLIQKALKSKVNAHRENYKRKHNEVYTMICKANSNYTRTLLSENSRNPDGFLAAIKRVVYFLWKQKT